MNTGRLLVISMLSLALVLGAGCGMCDRGREAAEGARESRPDDESVSGQTAGAGTETGTPGETWRVPEGAGSFYVASVPPGAEIMVNGHSVGERTPYFFPAEPGAYDVRIALPGFTPTPEVIELEVKEGSTDTLFFAMVGEPLAAFPLVAKDEKEVGPRWSRDGTTIVFEAYYGGNRDIYTIPITGGEPTRITFDQKADFAPCWSPDGKEIVFSSNRDGTVDLWIVSAAGGEPRKLAAGEGAEENAVFSPDGKWIAFESVSKIWKMPANGGKMEQVTTGPDRHFYPTWSPDSKEIAFTVLTEGARQIWAVSVGTGAVRKIVADKGWNYAPNWSPLGKAIVFVRRGAPPDNNHDLWICSAAGGELTQLTLAPAQDQYPSWSPDGRSLVWSSQGNLWVMMSVPGWLIGEEVPEEGR